MAIEISALAWVPTVAQGYVKDLRVRWALEEVGVAYVARPLDDAARASDAYRRRQPFGLVPTFVHGDVEMFESGAIVQHIAERSPALSPPDGRGRARVASWIFAAATTFEPVVDALNQLNTFHAGEAWTETPRPAVEAKLAVRLAGLAAWLGPRDHLEDRFTAGDLMMAMVLRELADWTGMSDFPTVDAYWRRCTGRPAFTRALQAQLADYRNGAPT